MNKQFYGGNKSLKKQLKQNICASCVIFKEDQFCEAAQAVTYILPSSGPYLLLQCNALGNQLLPLLLVADL